MFKSTISILSKYDLTLISDFSCQYNIGQYRHENLLHKLIKNYTALIWSLLLYQEQKRFKVCKVLNFNFCLNLLGDTSHVLEMKADIIMLKKIHFILKLEVMHHETWILAGGPNHPSGAQACIYLQCKQTPNLDFFDGRTLEEKFYKLLDVLTYLRSEFKVVLRSGLWKIK